MVEITVRWRGELESPETDVIERLVVNTERLVSVLNKLMYRQRGIVRLHNSVRHLPHVNNSVTATCQQQCQTPVTCQQLLIVTSCITTVQLHRHQQDLTPLTPSSVLFGVPWAMERRRMCS